MAKPTRLSEWIAAAEDRVRGYLSTHVAAVRPELVTNLAELYFDTDSERYNIDPHVSGPAVSQMLRRGELMNLTGATRGGRQIETFILDIDGVTTAQDRTAARKRLLYARYLSWTSGSPSRAGTAGPAAEVAVRTALSGVANIAPLMPAFGPVAEINGVILPGPLDSGAYVSANPAAPPVVVPLEVKNVRYWLYPNSEEPWQLIWKALAISAAEPTWRVAPVLVCRRAHPTQGLGKVVRVGCD